MSFFWTPNRAFNPNPVTLISPLETLWRFFGRCLWQRRIYQKAKGLVQKVEINKLSCVGLSVSEEFSALWIL